ncbi:MAG: hypothetical protein QXJ06_04985 [Candidatus Aenigmatarchaeota archaeon]
MNTIKIKLILLILILFLGAITTTLAKNNEFDTKNTLLKIIINLLAQIYLPNTSSLPVPERQQLSPQENQPPLPEPSPTSEIPPNQPIPTTTIINFDNKIKARPLWAGACHLGTNEEFKCNYSEYVPLINFSLNPIQVISNNIILSRILEHRMFLGGSIAQQLVDKKMIDIDKIDSLNNSLIEFVENIMEENYKFKIRFFNCSASSSLNWIGNMIINLTCSLDFNLEINGKLSVNLNKVFDKNNKLKNISNDQAQGIYEAIFYSPASYSGRFIKILREEDNMKGQIIPGSFYEHEVKFNLNNAKYSGKIKNLNFRFNMNGYENYATGTNILGSLFHLDNEGIKVEKFIWYSTSDGQLNGLIDGEWDWSSFKPEDKKYKINKFDFCPNKCSISIKEKLEIKARKELTENDRREGEIYISQNHEETFGGIGVYDPDSKTIFWNRVTVIKDDQRKWDRKINYVMPNGEKYKWSYYNGEISSFAFSDSNYFSGQTKIYKNLLFDEVLPTSGGFIFKTTKNGIVDREESNNNNIISRQGTGSVTISSGNSSFYIKGVYDNLSGLMKVISPKEMADQRIDPIEYLNPGDRAYNITEIFGPGGFYVPGFFTATYGNPTTTVAMSKPLKLLPKTIVFLWSQKENDSVLTPRVIAKINTLIKWLQSRGVTVIQFRTNSKDKMISAFERIPNGSFIFNIGHGLPFGLKAGDDIVYYYEINSLIEKNNLKIDGFSGTTCYAGRASLSTNIIGALGVVSTELNLSLGPGRIIGFGTNPWNMTTGDILSLICNQ